MQTALADFRASLARVRDVVDDIVQQAPTALTSQQHRLRHETIQFASTVILSGYFESFLRDLARAYIRGVCALSLPFSALPQIVRTSHYEYGAEVLGDVAKAERSGRPANFQTSSVDLAERLRSTAHGPPYELVWEAFAHTGANPGPDVIKEYLKRMGVGNVWPSIERKTTAAAAHQTQTWIRSQLDSFIAIRNECAHTGSASIQVLPSSLLGYCDVLEALGTALVEVLEDNHSAMAAAVILPGGSGGTGSGSSAASSSVVSGGAAAPSALEGGAASGSGSSAAPSPAMYGRGRASEPEGYGGTGSDTIESSSSSVASDWASTASGSGGSESPDLRPSASTTALGELTVTSRLGMSETSRLNPRVSAVGSEGVGVASDAEASVSSSPASSTSPNDSLDSEAADASRDADSSAGASDDKA